MGMKTSGNEASCQYHCMSTVTLQSQLGTLMSVSRDKAAKRPSVLKHRRLQIGLTFDDQSQDDQCIAW